MAQALLRAGLALPDPRASPARRAIRAQLSLARAGPRASRPMPITSLFEIFAFESPITTFYPKQNNIVSYSN